ncbi:low specificity L-threonine aldolase [uncultured Megasphaera sp.]|uniref:threonine aldolase family protein n=1 Tax=uncultured Megasphaera sp. TaxID=165188 RepID=UPI00265AC630|nr:aminotransferase class I/II-fold pyridoxal phosphate-dependent enzyme [uncultured Megasphaera sp.]
MIRFECDYLEGAPQPVLDAVVKASAQQHPGYGFDENSDHAKQLIRKACQLPASGGVHFLVGGTQANLTIIAALLKPYQGVIAPDTSHISNHETGAIEATGHKILALSTDDGKLHASQVEALCAAYEKETHKLFFVQPGMVYVSQTTEMGTMYTKQELADLYAVCRKYGLKVFVDGARLGYALAAPDCDMTLADLPQLCDVFTLGGTKQGALFGEAVVTTDAQLNRDLPYHIKQHGGLLAKGWLLGVQYEALFTDNLYLRLAKHAADLAVRIHDSLAAMGFSFLYEHRTNQQLPILTEDQFTKLNEQFSVDHFADLPDGRIAARICASWATKEDDVTALLAYMKTLK